MTCVYVINPWLSSKVKKIFSQDIKGNSLHTENLWTFLESATLVIKPSKLIHMAKKPWEKRLHTSARDSNKDIIKNI